MNLDLAGGSAQRGQYREFAEAEVVVENQSHSLVQPIPAQGDILPSSQFSDLQIEGIEIISQIVSAASERFARILGAYESHLHIVAIPELIAHPVLILISQVSIGSVAIALALIERHFHHSHHLVLAILQDVLQAWELLAGSLIGYIEETVHQLPLIPADTGDEGQFCHRLHPVIAMEICLDILYLRRGEERQMLHLFAGSRIQIQRMLRQLLQFLLIILPGSLFEILHFREFHQIFLPRLRRGMLLPIFFRQGRGVLGTNRRDIE